MSAVDSTPRPALSSPVLAALFVPLWSTGFVTARLVAPHAEPLTFLGLRFGAAGLLLAIYALYRGALWPATLRGWLDAFVAGMLIHGLYLGAVFWSVAHGLPSGISALVAGLQPLLTGLLARPLLDETVTPRRAAGIVVGALGAGLTLLPKLGAAGEGGIPTWPLAVCTFGMVAITFGTIWQKRRGRGADLATNTAIQYAGALAPMLIGIALTERGHFDVAAPAAWAGLVWSVFGMSIGAILLLMVLIHRGAVAQVASLLYLVPGVSALMAWAMFGEALTPVQIAGLLVAALGVAIANKG
ncbi:DMT family transporter [Labrys monachus]|uniref:Drug/metabolite transporter (DMT)-like permease n=1 Tax=Labrys monachus TaxID=217067 RepID=A0ABU0FQS1_9HYPH|nr:EamA family transporter [Labrys monachus]MDQ0396449.1 drug/metabolite transporter (DMT)-like permease [Labrys monachus]